MPPGLGFRKKQPPKSTSRFLHGEEIDGEIDDRGIRNPKRICSVSFGASESWGKDDDESNRIEAGEVFFLFGLGKKNKTSRGWKYINRGEEKRMHLKN